MHELIKAFIEYANNQRQLSPNTVAAYLYDLHKFNAYLENHTLTLEQITQQRLRAYTAYLKQSLRLASVARNIATLRKFWRYARTVQKLALKPLQFKVPVLPKKAAPSFAPQSLEAVINANIRDRSLVNIRNVLITYLLCRSRMTPTQLATLKVSDSVLINQKICFKLNEKERTVTLPKQLILLFEHYIKTLSQESYLFPSITLNSSQALPRQAFWSIAKKCLRAAYSLENKQRSVRYTQYYRTVTFAQPAKNKTLQDRLRAVYEEKHPRS